MKKRKIISTLLIILMAMALCTTYASAADNKMSKTENQRIDSAQWYTVAIKGDGTVWTWGNSEYGLGDGITTQSGSPIQVKGIKGVVAVSAGHLHTLALKGDGTVWAWGNNGNGQLGDGTTTSRSTPVKVKGLTNVIAISAGIAHSVALKKDGTVWVWGDDSYFGPTEDGEGFNFGSTPVQIKGLADIEAVAAGSAYTAALKRDGTVWEWGFIGRMICTFRPGQVKGLTNVAALSAGTMYTVALKEDGTVWAWGDNEAGQLGNGTTNQSRSPVRVKGLTGIKSITAGAFHTIALNKEGMIWAWGYNEYGQLGDGTTINRSSPVKVKELTGVEAIAAGNVHTLAVKDGSIWAWGWNINEQFGVDYLLIDSYTPIKSDINLKTISDSRSVKAKPINSNVMIDGKKVTFEAYNINENNYFKIRDLAMALNGSSKQFDVTWDGIRNAIILTSNHPYSAIGGELLISGKKGNKIATLITPSKAYLNGKQVALAAYNIDGNSYFMLRDVGYTLDFDISWNSYSNTISINTSKKYNLELK